LKFFTANHDLVDAVLSCYTTTASGKLVKMVDSSRGRVKPVIAPRGKGRRTQTERERLQQEESLRTRAKDEQLAREREDQRLAVERAERGKQKGRGGYAGRGGRGGGRGGFMGETLLPSGPFSAGSVIPREYTQAEPSLFSY
jgi:hypothetical protein